MKVAGASAVGLGAIANVASADEITDWHFYGCTQVCTDWYGGVNVVVADNDTLHCRPMSQIWEESDRNDPPVRDWETVYCYELTDPDEKIVGLCVDGNFHHNEGPQQCARDFSGVECGEDVC